MSVGCSDLETQLTQLGEHWLSSTTKVNKELHRLDSTLKHWSRSVSDIGLSFVLFSSVSRCKSQIHCAAIFQKLSEIRCILHLIHINFRYQRESAELSHWLQSALDRLEFWTTQSVTVPQELETVRDHLYAFLVSLVIKWAAKMYCRPNILIAI